MLMNLVSVRDEHANFVKMKYDIDMYKINLDDAIKKKQFVTATLHPGMQHVNNVFAGAFVW